MMEASETDRLGRTELHYAALEGDEQRVNDLLASGADPDAVDGDAHTALHFASQSGHLDAVRHLLRGGASVDLPNRFGGTPLWVAVMHSDGGTAVVEALLGAGADPDRANASGITPRELVEDSPPDDLHRVFGDLPPRGE